MLLTGGGQMLFVFGMAVRFCSCKLCVMLNGSRKVTRLIGSLVANKERKNANREIELQRAVECLQSAKMRIKLHHVMAAGHPRVVASNACLQFCSQ